MAILRVEHLSKSFGATTVLTDVALTVEKGEILIVIGPSGSGKTTLLRCIHCLEHPDRGTIVLDGVPFGRGDGPGAWQPDPPRELDAKRRRVGFVFQRFNLFANLTALDNVSIGPRRVLGVPAVEARTRAAALLGRLGLAEHAAKLPSQLSGGQQQRVAIARALSMDPLLMLFDEPTSALDPELVDEVLQTMRQPGSLGDDDDRCHARAGFRPRGRRSRPLHGRRPHRRGGPAGGGLQPAPRGAHPGFPPRLLPPVLRTTQSTTRPRPGRTPRRTVALEKPLSNRGQRL